MMSSVFRLISFYLLRLFRSFFFIVLQFSVFICLIFERLSWTDFSRLFLTQSETTKLFQEALKCIGT